MFIYSELSKKKYHYFNDAYKCKSLLKPVPLNKLKTAQELNKTL